MIREALSLALVVGILGAPLARAQEDPDVGDEGVVEGVDVENLDVESALDDAGVEAGELDIFSEAGEVLDSVDPGDLEAELQLQLQAQQEVSEAPGIASEDLRTHYRKVPELLHAPDGKSRASAARSLGRKGGLLSVTPLIVALRDRDPRVRESAAEALGKVGSFEALGALRRAWQEEVDDKAKADMDRAIGSIEERVFAEGAGPVVLVCHSCGRRFCLYRKALRGYCPYDGVPWTLK